MRFTHTLILAVLVYNDTQTVVHTAPSKPEMCMIECRVESRGIINLELKFIYLASAKQAFCLQVIDTRLAVM